MEAEQAAKLPRYIHTRKSCQEPATGTKMSPHASREGRSHGQSEKYSYALGGMRVAWTLAFIEHLPRTALEAQAVAADGPTWRPSSG